MSGDQRAELARAYLAEARQRSVEELAPTLLMRECAELRRLLGQVLAVLDGLPPALTDAQRVIVLTALADAETYVTERAAAWCDACESAPEGACAGHVEDLDQADVYRQLARELGGAR